MEAGFVFVSIDRRAGFKPRARLYVSSGAPAGRERVSAPRTEPPEIGYRAGDQGGRNMKNFKSYLAGVVTALAVCGMIGTASATVGKVQQELEYRNIKVSLDGEILDLRNAIGEPVEPFMFGGTNYLPVRALAEALGLQVAWDGANATVVLTTPAPEESGIRHPQQRFPGPGPAGGEPGARAVRAVCPLYLQRRRGEQRGRLQHLEPSGKSGDGRPLGAE